MEQHPVPQQISSYQFRLVGDMTLKQFFQLAGGALVALLFYSSNLPGFFKWPFITVSALTGAALAFLPLEERPLEVWIMGFFRAIYAPTLFYWKKSDTPPQYFTPDTQMVAPAPQTIVQQQAQTTLEPTPSGSVLNRLEEGERNFMSRITSVFSMPAAPSKPQEVLVPQTKLVSVEPQKPITQVSTPTNNTIFQTGIVSQVLPQSLGQQSATAQFSAEAAPPTPPTQANVVVGQVMDNQGKIVEGAILEIKDAQGRPARALKTNRVGHFLIVTPLSSGKYEMVIDKQGLEFDPVSFEASGQIIPPIAIKAKLVVSKVEL